MRQRSSSRRPTRHTTKQPRNTPSRKVLPTARNHASRFWCRNKPKYEFFYSSFTKGGGHVFGPEDFLNPSSDKNRSAPFRKGRIRQHAYLVYLYCTRSCALRDNLECGQRHHQRRGAPHDVGEDAQMVPLVGHSLCRIRRSRPSAVGDHMGDGAELGSYRCVHGDMVERPHGPCCDREISPYPHGGRRHLSGVPLFPLALSRREALRASRRALFRKARRLVLCRRICPA